MERQTVSGKKWVRIWLFTGVVMVFVQIVLGGITRLTGSGLSITKWDIVTGVVPPWTEHQWEEAFDLYKETPQYQKINQGMALKTFKFIFFWEYFHRLWARSMGVVFVLPFLVFSLKGWLSKDTYKRLGIVIGFAALAAIFGWIMVASGLVNRPWVNAYKLSIHLSLGIALFMSLVYTWVKEREESADVISRRLSGQILVLFIVGCAQVIFGAWMSGMKAALMFPSWPKMGGKWFPDVLLDNSNWALSSFLLYDHTLFMPALVQVLHRCTGYLIGFLILLMWIRWQMENSQRVAYLFYLLTGIIGVQVVLGILTLIYSKGTVPIFLGVSHQAVGILLITYIFYLNFNTKTENY